MGSKENQNVKNENLKDQNLAVSNEEGKPSLCTVRNLEQDQENIEVCRVCYGSEPDQKGEAALEFLGIIPPLISKQDRYVTKTQILHAKNGSKGTQDDTCTDLKSEEMINYVEYRSPDGEVFVCGHDLEAGTDTAYRDVLIDLGCSCKNDLSLGHYSCALRWFISHGSVVCEICGNVAENVKPADMNKVMSALKECETLRAMTAAGETLSVQTQRHSTVDPVALAAVRRQRLTEIASWFNPRLNTPIPPVPSDDASNASPEEPDTNIHPATKWVVEGTGILVATGLLTVTLAWLIAPRVGKKTANSGLHILLGGLCALTVVIFLRFAVLPRIKYGRARYWAIVFVFMFLVFGIWASRSKKSESH